MCCKERKFKLPSFNTLPEPLLSLSNGDHREHPHFMGLTRKYNNFIQLATMTIGATKVINEGYMPTFQVQVQVFHLVGSVLPAFEIKAPFLQIYFIGYILKWSFTPIMLGLIKMLLWY